MKSWSSLNMKSFDFSNLCPQTFNGPRCDMYENILAHGCSAAAVITAESSMSMKSVRLHCCLYEKHYVTLCSDPLQPSSPHLSAQAQVINTKLQQSQVFPQLMNMTFLPGEEKQVDIEVFAPTKGPLDLYILMDFSNSMADDLDNLKRMGEELGEQHVLCCH